MNFFSMDDSREDFVGSVGVRNVCRIVDLYFNTMNIVCASAGKNAFKGYSGKHDRAWHAGGPIGEGDGVYAGGRAPISLAIGSKKICVGQVNVG